MRDWQRIAGVIIIAALMGTHATAQAEEAKAGDGFVDQKDNLTRPGGFPWFLPDEIGVRLLAGRFSSFAPIEGIDQESRTSFYPDLIVRFRFGLEHALQTGVAYVQKGAVLNGDADIGTADYITIPLLYRISPRSWSPSTWVQPYATAGGYLGLLVGGNFNDFDEASKYDVGASVGAGVNVHVSPAWIMDVGVQYSQGFFSVVDGAQRTNQTVLFAVAATWDLGGDDDADGLLNRRETRACWTAAEDWDQWAGQDGCPDTDNDRDGLRDDIDPCPDAPEDVDGFRDWDGCPDTDNDGDMVADMHDQCTDEPLWGPLDRPSDADLKKLAKAERNDQGCFPDYKAFHIRPYRDRLRLRDGYLLDDFDLNSATLKPAKHREALDEIAEFLTTYWYVELNIGGHRSVGEKNRTDVARAEAVKTYLTDKGIAPQRLTVTGLADRVPAGTDCPKFKKVPPPKPGNKPGKPKRLNDLEELGAAIGSDQKLFNEKRKLEEEYEGARKAWDRKRKVYKDYINARNAAQACLQRTGPRKNRRVTFEIQ